MVSAWAVRGRVKAEARRAKVKRALRIEEFPSFAFCGLRMRPSGGGVKVELAGWERFERSANAHISESRYGAPGNSGADQVSVRQGRADGECSNEH
jgi:hypothetical protein